MALRPLLAALLLAACAAAGAQVLQEADAALRARDPAKAVRLLQEAADKGDLRAKGRLATLLVNLPEPERNPVRGCRLAVEAAAAGDSAGQAAQAQCLVAGILPEPDRFARARELARKSQAQKDPYGSFALFVAFSADPKNNWRHDGKPDVEAYKALAARPVSGRAEQAEALDALASAAAAGHHDAAVLLATYFYETAGPLNARKLQRLLPALAANGIDPPAFRQFARLLAEMEGLGTTQASARTFTEVARVVGLAAATAASAGGGAPCRDARLRAVKAGPLREAQFLPLQHPLMVESYLVAGRWDETWSYDACGKPLTFAVRFEADGWGGTRFATEQDKS